MLPTTEYQQIRNRGFRVAGYTFDGEDRCGPCTIEAWRDDCKCFACDPEYLDGETDEELILDVIADAHGITRWKEDSFDSYRFPVVLFGSEADACLTRCSECDERL